MIVSKENSAHYNWGNNCSGWHLVKTDSLSVIEELMPPNTSENRHYHSKSQQFFRILKGIATFEIGEEAVEVSSGKGIHIPAGIKHLIQNKQAEELEFLVISRPSTRNDRIEESSRLPGR